MRILYVENNPRFANLAVEQFLVLHEVTVVPSLTAARQMLAHSSFHVVLLDYDLDDGKGSEPIRELQSQIQRPNIIAVSSHQDGNNSLLAAGADAVCSKTHFSNIEAVLAGLLPNGS